MATKKKKPKQTEIPGTERKVNVKVRKAAEAYVDARDERMDLTKTEGELKAKLVVVMKQEKVSHYVDPDTEMDVVLTTTDDVKVKRKGAGKD